MQIDVTQELKTLSGAPIPVDETREPFTLRAVCVNVLLGQAADERGITGEEKFKRYELARKIYNEDKPELSVEDLALLKKLIGAGYAPLVVGQAWQMIDPK